MARQTLDAAGMAVTPGFIDLQNLSSFRLPRTPDAATLLRQGITTVLLNATGGPADDIWPIAAYLYQFEKSPPAVNVAVLADHNTLRHQAIRGMEYDRPANPGEIALMQRLLRRAMREGAFGLSTHLAFGASAAAGREELLALLQTVRESGGIAVVTPRDVIRTPWKSLRELEELSQISGQNLLVRGLLPAPRRVWRQERRWRQFLQPGSGLIFCLPPLPTWYGRIDELVPQNMFFNWREVSLALYRLGGAGRIRIVRFPADSEMEGHSLSDLARSLDLTPQRAFMEVVKAHGALVSLTNLTRERLFGFLAADRVVPVSSGGLDVARPHSTIATAAFLQSQSPQPFSFSKKIYKMTGFPAELLGLRDRGRIARGCFADLLIFDPQQIRIQSTADPLQPQMHGMKWVIVNGRIALRDGEPTAIRAGRVLRHPSENPRLSGRGVLN